MPRKARYRSIKARAAALGNRPCAIHRCPQRNNGLSPWCGKHRQRAQSYGHPEGRRIWPRDYRGELAAVVALFEANAEHAGLRTATGWVAEWMQQSTFGDKAQPGYQHMRRLSDHGVTPLDVLIECSAVWLYAMRNPRTLPDDARLTFALAVAVIGLAPLECVRGYRHPTGMVPFYRRARSRVRQAIGEHLRSHLARLFVNVVRGVEQQEQQVREASASMSLPFAVAVPSGASRALTTEKGKTA